MMMIFFCFTSLGKKLIFIETKESGSHVWKNKNVIFGYHHHEYSYKFTSFFIKLCLFSDFV